MMYKKGITITREEFHDKMREIIAKLTTDGLMVFRFVMFCIVAEMEFFREEDDDTDTEAPFKEGDEVFVIDNKNDHNCFVNQVVTIINVGENLCDVTNGDTKQTIYFKNLRKVVN